MKKVFALLVALAFGFGLKAQCPLTQAVDFTATDCHGTQVHLFDILDGGQAVLIDFFFTSCNICQQAAPKITESYTIMGCNQHDVFYIEISDRDSNTACQTWCQTYGIEYPTISGAAGGAEICNTYNIGGFPTVILIMPDRHIVIQDLWPVNNTQTIVTALEQQGIQPHACKEGIDETENQAISLYPNPSNDFVTLKGEDLGMVRVYNAIGQMVEEFETNGNEININTTGYENGIYVVKTGEKALRFVIKH